MGLYEIFIDSEAVVRRSTALRELEGRYAEVLEELRSAELNGDNDLAHLAARSLDALDSARACCARAVAAAAEHVAAIVELVIAEALVAEALAEALAELAPSGRSPLTPRWAQERTEPARRSTRPPGRLVAASPHRPAAPPRAALADVRRP